MPVPFVPLYSALIAFGLSLLAGPSAIAYLRRLKLGQQIRDDGPQSHRGKAGTPTMGGVLMVVSIVVAVLVFRPLSNNTIMMLFATVGFGVVGFWMISSRVWPNVPWDYGLRRSWWPNSGWPFCGSLRLSSRWVRI